MTKKTKKILKAITWRVIAAVTTFTVAMFVFEGCEGAMEKSTIVTAIETVIKLGLYYFHDSMWDKVEIKENL